MFNTYLNRKHSVIPKRVSWSIIKSIWLNITDKGHVFTLINIYILENYLSINLLFYSGK